MNGNVVNLLIALFVAAVPHAGFSAEADTWLITLGGFAVAVISFFLINKQRIKREHEDDDNL